MPMPHDVNKLAQAMTCGVLERVDAATSAPVVSA